MCYYSSLLIAQQVSLMVTTETMLFFVRDSPAPVASVYITVSLDGSVFNDLSLCRLIFVPAKQPTVLSMSSPHVTSPGISTRSDIPVLVLFPDRQN